MNWTKIKAALAGRPGWTVEKSSGRYGVTFLTFTYGGWKMWVEETFSYGLAGWSQHAPETRRAADERKTYRVKIKFPSMTRGRYGYNDKTVHVRTEDKVLEWIEKGAQVVEDRDEAATARKTREAVSADQEAVITRALENFAVAVEVVDSSVDLAPKFRGERIEVSPRDVEVKLVIRREDGESDTEFGHRVGEILAAVNRAIEGDYGYPAMAG